MLLTNEFIKKYEEINPMNPLGTFVYYRTYSRYIDGLKRRETWLETVRRAVEYNCSLAPTTQEEAEELFDTIYNGRGYISGRTFWIAGTDSVKNHPLANFNCSLVVLNKFEKLGELFYALLVGTGVGFRVIDEDVKNLPTFRKVKMKHRRYIPRQPRDRQESTSLEFRKRNQQALIHIGDSKNGWVQALKIYLDIITKKEYKHIEEIAFVYNSVRPSGEKLKGFGGTASGHLPLVELFTKFNKIVQNRVPKNEEEAKPEAIDLLDFANIIASIVVCGGVRRSAEIALIGRNQQQLIQAKNNLYTQDKDGNWIINKEIAHRSLSNNTIIHWEKPSREFWKWQFEQMRYSGEPASYNGEQALKRNPNFQGTNPCGEVLLSDQMVCNLVTDNVMAHVTVGKLDREAVLRTHKLLTRASYRMTCIELIDLPEWNVNLHRDRMLGVSLTGWQDMVNAVNMTMDEQKALLQDLRAMARNSADELADSLGLNRSLLVTTLKPEGTLSLLAGVSSGLHFPHSEYYIRRVRINANDPLAKVCIALNYPVVPEVGQDWENAQTLVIEFPVKSPKGRTKFDVSAVEQLEIYKMFMEDYVDHNASITVSCREHEWAEAEQWMYDNWDSTIGVSFISLDDSYYQLMPFEAINEEEYNRRLIALPQFDPSILSIFESGEEFDLDGQACESGGACPIR